MEAFYKIAKREISIDKFAVVLLVLMFSTYSNAVSADKVEIKRGVQDYFCTKVTQGNWVIAAQTLGHFVSFSKRRYPQNSLSELIKSMDCRSGLNPLQFAAYRGARVALRVMVKEYDVDVNILDWDGYTLRDYVQNQLEIADSDFRRERFRAFLDFLHHEFDAKHSAKWLRENQ